MIKISASVPTVMLLAPLVQGLLSAPPVSQAVFWKKANVLRAVLKAPIMILRRVAVYYVTRFAMPAMGQETKIVLVVHLVFSFNSVAV